MMTRNLIPIVMMCGVLAACSDNQDAATQQSSQAQQSPAATPPAAAKKAAPMPDKAAQAATVQNMPFANASKAPTEETRRMADLLNQSGKAGGSLVEAAQSQSAAH